MNVRASGLLLHPTSLPGPYGIGDLGPEAYRFIEFLVAAGQSIWQMLPLNPVDPERTGSPYHSVSAFAGNLLLISPDLLVEEGWLQPEEIVPPFAPEAGLVDFQAVEGYKSRILRLAFDRLETRGEKIPAFERFCAAQSAWLKDYALFAALKERHGQAVGWIDWPQPLRDRAPEALDQVKNEAAREIKKHQFWQYLFFRQWWTLKQTCNRRGIRIFGDLPIYMPLDSVDVWCHPQQYRLDERKIPAAVSGVPPDYFSETGQLWGHPVYNWDYLKETGYQWWLERFRHNLSLFDRVRIDHFRGLVAYWEVPASAKTAEEGRWQPVPVYDLFSRLFRQLGPVPLVAEDLGTITADVRECIHRFDLPGMRVLQFAFGDDFPESDFLPHHHLRHSVVYTGTHDNNTIRGWFDEETDRHQKSRLWRYLGRRVTADRIHQALIRLAMMSVADTVIIPVQDVLGLGSEARMNHPAVETGNWSWRLTPGRLSRRLARGLLDTTACFGRAP